MRLLETKYRTALGHLKAAYTAMQLPLDMAGEAGDDVSVILLRGEFRNLWHQVKEFARCRHGLRVLNGRGGRS